MIKKLYTLGLNAYYKYQFFSETTTYLHKYCFVSDKPLSFFIRPLFLKKILKKSLHAFLNYRTSNVINYL